MTDQEILKHIDHTQLKPFATWEDIKKLCDEAVEYICSAEDGYMVFGHSFMYSNQFCLFDSINQTIIDFFRITVQNTNPS